MKAMLLAAVLLVPGCSFISPTPTTTTPPDCSKTSRWGYSANGGSGDVGRITGARLVDPVDPADADAARCYQRIVISWNREVPYSLKYVPPELAKDKDNGAVPGLTGANYLRIELQATFVDQPMLGEELLTSVVGSKVITGLWYAGKAMNNRGAMLYMGTSKDQNLRLNVHTGKDSKGKVLNELWIDVAFS